MTGITIALVLPWLFGCVSLLLLLGRSRRWNVCIITGHGYLTGLVLTTLVIRLWDFAGIPLNYWGIVTCITLLTIAGCITLRFVPANRREKPPAQPMEKWQILLLSALIAMILYRYGAIAREVMLRPLYPWDAWMNWVPKAVVWYSLHELVPYISPVDWLHQSPDTVAYTAGASKTWSYPVTVPLIQLWGMLGAQASDQNFSNLPWLFAPLAFGLSLFGHLRLLGASALLATTACYILLSIPYINVHSALAGYADIWLAFSFGAAVLSLSAWQESRHWAWGALSLFFAFTCTQLKLPGMAIGGIIAMVFLVSLIPLSRRFKYCLVIMVPVCILMAVYFGINISVPSIGQIDINSSMITLPYLGTFQLGYHPVHQPLISTTFYMINWNILWYLFALLLALSAYKGALRRPASLELQSIALLLLFLFLIFNFTHIHKFVRDYTTVNRVLLYAVPAMVFYIFKTICTRANFESSASTPPTPYKRREK